MTVICPICGEDVPLADGAAADVTCPRCQSTFAAGDLSGVASAKPDATTVGPSASGDQTLSAGLDGSGRPRPTADYGVPQIPGYHILGQIARGGMGIVLKAHHVVLDRPVAIKIPLPRQLATQQDKDRFLREARAAARLRHPNICPIYDVGMARLAKGGFRWRRPQAQGGGHMSSVPRFLPLTARPSAAFDPAARHT
jgi:hypothetical protein